MGTFNTLTFDWTDEQSKQTYHLVLQFKYGETSQYDYNIGDTLKWRDDEYDQGDKMAKEVLVEAIVEDESLSGVIPEDFEIFIKDNMIQNAYPLEDKMRYFNIGNNYIVLP